MKSLFKTTSYLFVFWLVLAGEGLAQTPAPNLDAKAWETVNQSVDDLYREGKMAEAEMKARDSLNLAKKVFGVDHLNVAVASDKLALFSKVGGRFAEAEALYKSIIDIVTKKMGAGHVALAATYTNLGEVYMSQDKYEQAFAMHNQALEIRKQALGPDHLEVAISLNHLAGLFHFLNNI